jgi:hypothetical protein
LVAIELKKITIMTNEIIKAALVKQKNDWYDKLNHKTISQLFKDEYRDMVGGLVAILGGSKDEMTAELRALSKDKSHDKPYQEKIKLVHALDNASIIKGFMTDLEQMLSFITSNGKLNELQALFIEYDYYYHFGSVAMGYGRQAYPLVTTPRYLNNDIDFNNSVMEPFPAIDFKPAWPNCEEFAWTNDHLTAGYDLEQLFKLNSHLLLHEALAALDGQGRLVALSLRPFTFYINEHDIEVMTLYRLD